MLISQDYAGKYIDICVLDTSSSYGNEIVAVGLLNSGSVIAGPYKIVQKFFKFLMTELGSVAAAPTYGTNFARLLLSGQIQNSAELKLRYYAEVKNVRNYLFESTSNPSSDEILVKAELESFEVSSDTATLRIRFTFQDNSKLLVPVSISTV